MIKYLTTEGKIVERQYDEKIVTIKLSSKKITQILETKGLSSLQELKLDCNKITEIKGLDKLSNLRKLWLDNNQITEIKGLNTLTNLQYIFLYSNQITEIKGLDGLTNLQELWLYNNQITEIKGLNGLIRLEYLLLGSNRITEIKGLDRLISLQCLAIYDNEITNVPFTIMNTRNLKNLGISCNIDPIIRRFLDRNKIKSSKSIYDDSQNVHDSNIVNSIKQSIYNIIGKSKEINIDIISKDIIDDKTLNQTTKQQLIEYCQDKTIHSLLNLTFEEILCSVWKIISEHKESDEIKKILNQEMKDSMCKCFTGRLSRLVNCLNGFDSRVSIKIDDKEQILNIIIKIRNKYENIDKQKEEVTKELIERGFDKDIINEYIIYLE
jgi:hypothetical protein